MTRPWRQERAPIDPDAKRYMIYRLHDAAGVVVYVGRSCDVANRIRAHHSSATHHLPEVAERSAWLFDARTVSMVGPYTWDEACKVERHEIETHQPRGNRQFTKAHGYRPLAEGGGQYPGRTPNPGPQVAAPPPGRRQHQAAS